MTSPTEGVLERFRQLAVFETYNVPAIVTADIETFITHELQQAREEGMRELEKELTTPTCMADTGKCTDQITYECIHYITDKIITHNQEKV